MENMQAQQERPTDTSAVEQLEYRVPAQLFAAMVTILAELPAKHVLNVLNEASALRPSKKG